MEISGLLRSTDPEIATVAKKVLGLTKVTTDLQRQYQSLMNQLHSLKPSKSDGGTTAPPIIDPGYDSLEERVSTLESKVSKVTSDVSAITSTVNAHTTSITVLNTSVNTLSTKVMENATATALVDEKVNAQDAKITGLQGTITAMNTTVQAQGARLTAAEANIVTAQEEVAALTTTVNAFDGRITTNETSIADLYTKLESVDIDLTDITADIESINTAIDQIQNILGVSKNLLGGVDQIADIAANRSATIATAVRRVLITKTTAGGDYECELDPYVCEFSFCLSNLTHLSLVGKTAGLRWGIKSFPTHVPYDHDGYIGDPSWEQGTTVDGGIAVSGCSAQPIWNNEKGIYEIVPRYVEAVTGGSYFERCVVGPTRDGHWKLYTGKYGSDAEVQFDLATEDDGFQDAVVIWQGMAADKAEGKSGYVTEVYQPRRIPVMASVTTPDGITTEYPEISRLVCRYWWPEGLLVLSGRNLTDMYIDGPANVMDVEGSGIAPNIPFIELILEPHPMINSYLLQEHGVVDESSPNYVPQESEVWTRIGFDATYYKSVYESACLYAQRIAAVTQAYLRETKAEVQNDSPLMDMMINIIQATTGLATSVFTLQQSSLGFDYLRFGIGDILDVHPVGAILGPLVDDGLSPTTYTGFKAVFDGNRAPDDGNQIYPTVPTEGDVAPDGYTISDYEWNVEEHQYPGGIRMPTTQDANGIHFVAAMHATIYTDMEGFPGLTWAPNALSNDVLENTEFYTLIYPTVGSYTYSPSLKITATWSSVVGANPMAEPGSIRLTYTINGEDYSAVTDLVPTEFITSPDGSQKVDFWAYFPPMASGELYLPNLVKVEHTQDLPDSSGDFQKWKVMGAPAGIPWTLWSKSHEAGGYIEYNVDAAFGIPASTFVLGRRNVENATLPHLDPFNPPTLKWETLIAPAIRFVSVTLNPENVYFDSTDLQEKVAIFKLRMQNVKINNELADLDARLDYIEEHSDPTLLGIMGMVALTVASFAAPGMLLTTSLLAGTALTVADAWIQGDVLKAVGWSLGALLHSRAWIRSTGIPKIVNVGRNAKDFTANYFRDVMPFPWRNKVTITGPSSFKDRAMRRLRDSKKYMDDVVANADYTDRDPNNIMQIGSYKPLNTDEIIGLGRTDSRGTVAIMGSGMSSSNPLLRPYVAVQERIVAHMNDDSITGDVASAMFHATAQPEHQMLMISQPLNVMGPAGLFPAEIKMNLGLGHGPQPTKHAEYLMTIGSKGIYRVGGPNAQVRKGAGIESAIIMKDGGTVDDPFGTDSILTLHSAQGTVPVTDAEIEAERIYHLRVARQIYDSDLAGETSTVNILKRFTPEKAAVEMVNKVNKHREIANVMRESKDCLLTPEAFRVLADWMEKPGGIRDAWTYARLNHNCTTFAKDLQDLIISNRTKHTTGLPSLFVQEFLAAQTTKRLEEMTFEELVDLQRYLVTSGLQRLDVVPRGA